MRLLPLLSLLVQAQSALHWKTHDISSLLVEERKRVNYKSPAGTIQPLEQILKAGGANSVKIRLWVDPPSGEYNLEYGLKLGRRAKEAGLSVVINFHYSDTWADPGHQKKPKKWEGLGTEALIDKVRSYTKETLDAFAAQNIDVDLVSVGNEVRAGLLWPTAKYDQMGNIAKVLTAGSQGVRASKYGTKAKVMVHLDRGYSWSTQEWFYDTIAKNGFSMKDVDVLGISYYPFWDQKDSTIENFRTNINNMARKYNKPIVVAETDWPTRCSKASENIPQSLRSIPFTAQGQLEWVKKVADVVKAVPGGLGQGLMYWEPGWIDNASLGSKCESGGPLFDGNWGNMSKVIATAHMSVNMFNSI